MSSDAVAQPNVRAMKYVGVACEACKKARRKCDGDDPCQACLARKIPCVFMKDKDGRRGRKRTLDQLYSKADALDVLLDSLRSSENDSLQELVQLIRNQASLEDVVQQAKAILQRNETRSKSRGRIRRTVLDIAALIDEPPIQVPAKPWTDVIDDDHAVSHLISVYFTWHHYGYPSVDRDIFVREMTTKNLSSRFCSPFLVNSILTIACMYTDHPSAFADPDDPSTRGLHFLAEATRLWIVEQKNISLSFVQALPSFISGAVAMGKDRDGIIYTGQSIAFATELRQEVKKNLRRGNEQYSTMEFQRSYNLAIWAAYMIQVEVAVAWSKPFDLWKPSKRDVYTAEELRKTEVWKPYPRAGHDVSIYSSILTTERIKLYEIAAELKPLLLSGEQQESPLPGYIVLDHELKLDGLSKIGQTLLEWRRNLPTEAQTGDIDSSIPAAPLTDLHLAYNCFRMCTATQILRMPSTTDVIQEDANNVILAASRDIARIFEWTQRTIGMTHFGVYHFHAASLCAYVLLECLDRFEVVNTFHTVIVALSAASPRWTLARGVQRMIWIELQQRKLDRLLNKPTLDLLKLSAVDTWGPEDHRLFEKCAYPNYVVAGERGHMLAEMGDLLQEYSRLNFSEASPQEKDT